MKEVRYLPDALKTLRRYNNMAPRIMRTMTEYATGSGAHVNQVKALRGTAGLRMRVGDFRVLFQETDDIITVVALGPRGGVYD